MPMVRHKAVREKLHSESRDSFHQDRFERAVVTDAFKEPASSRSPVEDVKHQARGSNALTSWHEVRAIATSVPGTESWATVLQK